MKREKTAFSKLKRKIFIKVLIYGVVAVVGSGFLISLLVNGFLKDPFGQGFIQFIMNSLNLDYETAWEIYYRIFHNNKQLFFEIAQFILLLILFYVAFNQITKYFDQISEGMDLLLEESKEEIVLSPEMDFMQKKMNQIKNTLETRAYEAREAEQRKNDLVVYLAHDIKTPLTSVIGYLNLLEEAPDMPQEQRAKYVGLTLEKAYRLEELINEFFEITRFNLQKIILYKERIHLVHMLQQMAEEFYPILIPQNKKVVIQGEEDLYLYADADKLARVFNNILKNAVSYSYNGSEILIEAKQTETNIVITFSNQGRPIPKEKLDTIFEKFYRLDSSRSSTTGGSGLGLAIAKEIVVAHQGKIFASSSMEQTVFTVILPRSGGEKPLGEAGRPEISQLDPD